MTTVYAVTTALLSAAALLVLVRLLRGPVALDRIVALDVLLSLIVAGAALGVAARGEDSSLPVLLLLAILAFIGSVTAAHLIERREGMR
ncbi:MULTISPECIES: monovalent cation/H+ antiporter complex subunit F [Streptomyces]|uniref:Sodium:proton antiporter n=2 Tax=Streptomyces TaxID=1883 RepID=A0A3R7LMB0_9ACTN|nr:MULTISPECIES: monovalent cation/H+ antiporter complex subunit F [Streptomyces]KNE78922.1 sodium:proton antiporter [Streptomyces fradiae]OFA47346.1 sodium:proton antiporter [Streptomyces fradiae]PQM21757.1 sodium:proton antiporter [Streptomyces xinghaiensis]RKM93190.1 sodium:proton antiporter [Streptomyces xinghaiensis]RNC71212.1 sodium:proton antiporter [Streptomyces xinghaiensis]